VYGRWGAHFEDVTVTPEGLQSDEDVHFFHELWELVRASPEVWLKQCPGMLNKTRI
jgi:hypothetical protein